ncbi:MAG: TOBE domain-containing protein, partial [Sphaerochaetaceae bacterium]
KQLDSTTFTLDFLGKKIVAPRWNKQITIGSTVLIVARPESITPEHPDDTLVEGTVTNSVYFGSQMLYEVALPDGKVLQIEVADPQYHPIFERGHKVGLAFKDRSLHVLPMEE